MAFDPDAYLAEKPQPKGKAFDPDAYLGAKAADNPGTVLATWTEPEPETGDRPKFLAEIPAYEPPVHLEKNPETGQLESVVGKDQVRAVFTDQPGAGQGGRVSAQALWKARPDTERLGKQAFVGGALQGATFGFGEELAAAGARAANLLSGDPAVADKTYAQIRDENRAQFHEAKRGDPKQFSAGHLAGGASTVLLPGFRAAGIGKPLLSLRNVGLGAGLGGLQAAGESEADLTDGEFGPFAKDVGKGAAAGAGVSVGLGLAGKGLSAAGNFIRGAPDRVASQADNELWDLLVKGAGKKEREELAGVLGNDRAAALDMARSNPAFIDALKKGDRKAAAETLLAAQPAVDERLGTEIAGMESRTGRRVTVPPFVKEMERRRDALRAIPSAENMAAADKWQKQIDAINEAWVPAAKTPELKGEALASRLTASADTGTRERAAANAAEFGKVAEKFKLGKDVDNLTARQAKIGETLEKLNGKTAEIYDRAGGTKGADIYVANVTGKLREWADELRKQPLAARQADAANIDKLASQIAESEAAAGRTVYTPKELRAEITRLQDKAFSGSYIDPTEARAMGRELSGKLRSILDEHVATHGRPTDVKKLAELNKQISTLIAFQDSTEREAVKAFEGLHKAPVVAPDTRTGRARVAELYSLIQSTKDPEMRQALTGELYRQLGPDVAKRLTSIEGEKSLLGRLGETMKTGAEQQAADAARGGRLRSLIHETHPIMAYAARFEKNVADKLTQYAASVEMLRRRGANNAQLRFIGEKMGLGADHISDVLRLTLPREAAWAASAPRQEVRR